MSRRVGRERKSHKTFHEGEKDVMGFLPQPVDEILRMV